MKLTLKIGSSLALSAALVWGAASLPRPPRESYTARAQLVCGQTDDTLELCRLLVPAESIYWVAAVKRGQVADGDILRCESYTEATPVPDGKVFHVLKLRCRDSAGTESQWDVRGYEYGPLEPLLKRLAK